MNVRPISEGDLAAVAALAAKDETALRGRASRIDVPRIRSWLGGVDFAKSSWLYEDGGELLAFALFQPYGDLGLSVGRVAPSAKGRGLGTQIVETGEARAREKESARAQAFVPAEDDAAAQLLERHGFAPVRRFYELAIELDTMPVVPALPDGLALDSFRTEDAPRFYETLDSAFQDHWGHHSLGFERWWEEKQRAERFDPTLWFLVRDGEEVAGVVRTEPERGGRGFVAALGVARPWRGRGLARALLLRTFAEFYARGMPGVTLDVDADSATGATRLYESVGMTIEGAETVYEKALA